MTLNAPDVLIPLLTFAVGVLVGVHVRVDRSGHTEPVTHTEHVAPRRRLSRITHSLDRPIVYLVGMAVAVSLGATASVLAYNATGNTADLTECIADYNTDAGLARDERAATTDLDRVAERAVWQNLYDQIAEPPDSIPQQQAQEQALATIQARIDSIDAVDKTVFENPYPDPLRCK